MVLVDVVGFVCGFSGICVLPGYFASVWGCYNIDFLVCVGLVE